MGNIRLIALMCGFLWLTLLGMHAVPALLPLFVELWSLSNTEAGWLAGMPYLATLIGVTFIGLTDRIDARWLLILGALVNALGLFGMSFADGFWSALGFRILQGLGFAWTYLPGAKAISDRISSGDIGRATGIYASSFAIGSSFSIFIAGETAAAFGWQWAFILPAVGNLAAAALVLLALSPVAAARTGQPLQLIPDLRPLLRNRRALGFVIGSFSHNFELLTLRGWTVAFLTWVVAARPGIPDDFNVPLVASLLILIGAPTSVIGSEIGHRIGYARAASLAMTGSAMVALLVGFAAAWPIWFFALFVFAHNFLVLADSGALNAGAMNAAEPAERGATMAAFGAAAAAGGLIGPVLFGYILDLTGGGQTAASWGWGFAALGLVMVAGALAVRALSGGR